METWTKLYQRILQSSVWKQPSDYRVVWIALLALKDESGYVYGTEGWLADQARVSPGQCREALSVFLAPDPSSRTADNDGRKIAVVKGGWVVLNHFLYRDGMDDLREKWRKQKANQRSRGKTAKEIIREAVEADPLTIQDKGVIAQKWAGTYKPVAEAIAAEGLPGPVVKAEAEEISLGPRGEEAPE